MLYERAHMYMYQHNKVSIPMYYTFLIKIVIWYKNKLTELARSSEYRPDQSVATQIMVAHAAMLR